MSLAIIKNSSLVCQGSGSALSGPPLSLISFSLSRF